MRSLVRVTLGSLCLGAAGCGLLIETAEPAIADGGGIDAAEPDAEPPPACSADTCFPDRECQTATCEGESCVRIHACMPGETCCIGDCMPCSDGLDCTLDVCGPDGCQHRPVNGECRDGNPCTDDECVPGVGCTFSPNTLDCDDGDFCNGPDICADGTCGPSGEPPCLGGLKCDPAMGACVGCEGSDECPDDSVTLLDSCLFDPADVCTESGTGRERHTSYECVGGVCIGTETVVPFDCARSTSGLSCGSRFCAYGPCLAMDRCATIGMRSESCTDYTCVAGICTTTVMPGFGSCMRDTDGNRCDDGVLCNGREVCLGGACRPDSSMLCPVGYTCDPARDACCRRDAMGTNICLDPSCGSCLLPCSGLGCPAGAGCGCRADDTCGCLPMP